MNNQNNNCMPREHDEIKEILEKIDALQKRAVREELQEKFCDNDFLNNVECCHDECNTRPISIFTHEDKSWRCPVERDDNECIDAKCEAEHDLTCVFRVEKVEDGTVTLRALKEKSKRHEEGNGNREYDEGGEYRRNSGKFKSTNSFITIKLIDIAAIRCLKDTFVDLCIR